MSEQIGFVQGESAISIPIWSVNHFLDNTASNYIKLISLRQICRRFADGAEDQDFLICVNSYDLFPAQDDLHYREDDLVVLARKDQSAENFWHYFRHLHRPVVLFRERDRLIPAYPIESDTSLKIRSLSLQSPVTFSLQGAIGALVDLFSGKILDQRKNERNAQALTNIRNIVETSHLIENRSTPPGVRDFAVDQLEAVMQKQQKINLKL